MKSLIFSTLAAIALVASSAIAMPSVDVLPPGPSAEVEFQNFEAGAVNQINLPGAIDAEPSIMAVSQQAVSLTPPSQPEKKPDLVASARIPVPPDIKSV